jgi:lipopolysaccharide/colanic/teichoic acid biosynthesis glycosyltransferase
MPKPMLHDSRNPVLLSRPRGLGNLPGLGGFIKAAFPKIDDRMHVTRITTGAGYRRLKRIIDIMLGSAIMIFILPVLVLCAIAIKLDSRGPIFFIQPRSGQGGKQFRMFKLRTMVDNADALKGKYRHLSTRSYPDFKIPDDPRVTRSGRVLRKLSLDELPQIFNVIRGDMSLVGPRPTSFSSSTYALWHTARLDAKPGMTGLWQVCGRSNIDFDNRTRLDLAYIHNQSLWLDIKILICTFGCIIKKEGM